jgi:hypothetical protein
MNDQPYSERKKQSGESPFDKIFKGIMAERLVGLPFVGSFQEGTLSVPQTGIAQVHQGEAIVNPQQAAAIRQLLSQLSQAQPSQGGMSVPGGGNPPGAGMQPPSANAAPQMPRLGGPNTLLPGGTAMPNIPGVPMSAGPGYQTKSVAARGAASLPMAAYAINQKLHNDKVQKYRGLANKWIAMQSNPDMQKQRQEQAKSNPEIAKVLAKEDKEFAKMVKEAQDPSSAADQGIQLAYKDQQMKEMQQQEFQQKLSDMRAQEEQRLASAVFRRQQESQMGQVTPAMQFKEQQKFGQQAQQIAGRLQQTQLTTSRMLEATKLRLASAERQTKVKAGATLGAAALRANATNSAIVKEYQAIQQQANELDRRSKVLQDHLDKNTHLGGLWEPDDMAEVQQEMGQIEAQKQMLAGQMQMLQMKDQFYQKQGIIPIAGSSGQGTQDDPVVVP